MKQLLKISLLLVVTTLMAMANTVTISFTDLPGQTAGGHYVGYTGATITSGSNTFVDFDLMCDDFTHTTYVPSGPFEYFVSTIPTLSNVRWTQSPMLTNYQMAAIILFTYDALSPVQKGAQAGDYNYALWRVFNPGVTPNYGNSSAVLSMAALAQSTGTFQGGASVQEAYDSLRIFTPTREAASNQEFLGISSDTFGGSPVPEPSTYAMLGGGLLSLGLLSRKRRA